METVDYSAISGGKHILAKIYCLTGLSFLEKFCTKFQAPYILAVNYHSTPEETVDNFEQQIRWFSDNYENVNHEKLASFLEGKWTSKRPGLMIHFDDGILNNATIAAPLLQKYGFTGWFQVITDYLDNPAVTDYSTMSWEQAKDLMQNGHEVCSHSCTHKRLNSKLTDIEIEHEVIGSYRRFAEKMGIPPFAFCYPGGEMDSYDSRAVRMVKQYYKYAFPTYSGLITSETSPYALPRCHIESGWAKEDIILSTGYLWRLKYRKLKTKYLKKI
jgi:peptidoglycan/xylan/chitin deacetylase (PgdA/CDA1 family)